MKTKIIKKIITSVLTLILAVTALFFIIRLTPGDPIENILGPEANPTQIEMYRQQLGLDQPIVKQYVSYMKGLVKFDLGTSLYSQTTVIELLTKHFPPTLMLALMSITVSFFIGAIFGFWSGFKKNSLVDNITRVVSVLALSFPIFSLAPILVMIFAIWLNLFPVSEWGSWRHMFLPTITLAIPLSAILLRVCRNKYLEESHAPWIQVLRAKGLSNFQILVRIFKVSLPTILNVVGIQLSVVLAGTMITETIFDIPGIGTLLLNGIQNRDYPVVQGIIMYSTVVYMVVYFIIDLVNTIIDPRIEA